MENDFQSDETIPAPEETTAGTTAENELSLLARIFQLIMKILRFPLSRIIVGCVICGSLPFIIEFIFIEPIFYRLRLEEFWSGYGRYFSGSVILLTVYALLFKYYEQRSVHELSLKHLVSHSVIGYGAGMVITGSVVWTLLATGAYRFSGQGAWMVVPGMVLYFIYYALVEEVIFRGILYRILDGWLGTIPSLVLTCGFFGFIHLNNPSATWVSGLSTGLLGVLLALSYTFSGRLWVPISAHAAWNFTLFYYGLAVSGTEEQAYAFYGEVVGPEWLTGGGFGPENSILTLILCVILTAWLFRASKAKGKIVPPFWLRKRIAEE